MKNCPSSKSSSVAQCPTCSRLMHLNLQCAKCWFLWFLRNCKTINQLTREQLIAALNFFLLFTMFTFRRRRFNPKRKHETVFGNVFCRSARSLYRLIIKTLKVLFFFFTCSGLNNNKYSSHVKSYCLSSNHYSAIQALRQLITEWYHAGAQWMQ